MSAEARVLITYNVEPERFIHQSLVAAVLRLESYGYRVAAHSRAGERCNEERTVLWDHSEGYLARVL